MIKRIAALVIALAGLAVIPGCASILNGHTQLYVTTHETPAATSPESVLVANTYDELKTLVLGFIREHADEGDIHVNSYGSDIQSDVDRLCTEVVQDDPLGAYAVSGITGKARKYVSYYDVKFNIDYNHNVTKKQIDDIVTVSTLRSLKSDLQDKLADYAPSLTVLTKGLDLTQNEALDMIQQIYYENPMDIVMLPVMTPPTFYPDHGPNRVIDFTFDYRYGSNTLTAMEDELRTKVQDLAVAVTGNSDGAILLWLAQTLMDLTKYDTATAESGDTSDQNLSATAYGALVTGSAVGEGYAMAYKALCDYLGYESYVVVGTLNGESHAWNIVVLEGSYYHIDMSMCDVNGIQTAFLKNDTEMKKASYSWDASKYKVCDGPLTYSDLVGSSSGGGHTT